MHNTQPTGSAPKAQIIAVMGSAFNPPTLGHADVIAQLESVADAIWLVPAFAHAWGKAMAPYAERCAMLAAFVADLHNPKLSMQAVEQYIASGGPVYSIDLLEYLERHKPANSRLLLVLGPDNQAAFAQFHRAAEIQARWACFFAQQRLAVRSTTLRAALQAGEPIDGFTTPGVARYLADHPLYRAG
ncbi:MAG: nicotinate-nicotinamide nucleotide adenylyltransferase [Aeromonadaceae bacterium]|nr:nicotinate-nicotinamide nucleotide adenylyltransferase [Aeromonadaceae bacterium]